MSPNNNESEKEKTHVFPLSGHVLYAPPRGVGPPVGGVSCVIPKINFGFVLTK